MSSFWRLFAGVGFTVLLLGFVAGEAVAEKGSKFREAVRSAGGVISTESPAASEVGLGVLDSGGNAVDAAVAAVFAVNVARPQSCGIGGGGFMVYRGADGETAALDFRETAPEAVEADTFDGDGLYNTFTGRTTVGVPGTVAGMQAALERYGTISLSEAVSPAEQLAREGVEVQPSLSREMGNNAARLKLFPAAAGQFLVDGTEPYEEGALLVQPELAETLALISREGADAFYRGAIAERIVAEMEREDDLPGNEGLMTLEDLAAYEAVWREPLVGGYRDAEVIAMPPPTSGGVAALQILNILEGFDLAAAGQSSADALHLIAEAQKIAVADRGEYLADPDFVDMPTGQLIDEGYAEERRSEIQMEEAGEYEAGDLGGPGEEGEDTNPDTNTTHISVVDAVGNAVALTCTIEQSFGSAVVAPGTGFLLNNELTDFSEPGTANEPAPGKRPRSSISPTIVVQDGQPTLVVGAAGGVTIIMGSLLAVVNVVDFGLALDEAVDAERLDAFVPPEILLEDGRVSPVVQADLIGRGHEVSREGEYADLPRVQAAGVDPGTGLRLAVTDPRSGEEEYAALGQDAVPMPDTGGASIVMLAGLVLALSGAVGLLALRRRL